MDKPKIAVIASDFELYSLALKIREEVDFTFEVVQSYLEDAVIEAKRLSKEGTIMFVSRGGTLDRLKKNLPDLPFITIPITEYEVAFVLAEARKLSSRGAVVAFSKPFVEAVQKMSPLMGLDLKIYKIASEEDVEPKVLQAHKEGAEFIIGFNLAYKSAAKHGIPAVQYNSEYAVVKKSLLEAANLLNILSREQEWKERQTTVLNSISSAVIIADKNGTIIDCNIIANSLLEFCSSAGSLSQIFGKHFACALSGKRASNILQSVGGVGYNCSLYPISIEKKPSGVVIVLEDLSRLREIEHTARRRSVEMGFSPRYTFSDILTAEPKMLTVIEKCLRYAQNDSTIVIYGESGTGKELLTQSIHNAGPRSKMPFVAINCGALPDNLVESELFGYVEGAFTGASRGGKIGVFEQAHRGTLFLDEVGEISPMAQSRLLRTLEERQIMRLGDNKVIPVDVRIIFATHRNLSEMAFEGSFRRDLFYRMNVLDVTIPPLRERKKDIRMLLDFFITALTEKIMSPRPVITSEAQAVLNTYEWPGNVRELRNVAERLVVSMPGKQITVKDITEILRLEPHALPPSHLTVRKQEELLILKTLSECNNNRSRTAQALGMSKSTLWRRLRLLGIEDKTSE